MTTHRKIAGALRFGIGAGLLGAIAFISGSANAQTDICSASGSGPTGRQYAAITVSPREPDICVRTKLGGIAPQGVPDCWSVARGPVLSCTKIVDVN
jgi:hypothetical protein